MGIYIWFIQLAELLGPTQGWLPSQQQKKTWHICPLLHFLHLSLRLVDSKKQGFLTTSSVGLFLLLAFHLYLPSQTDCSKVLLWIMLAGRSMSVKHDPAWSKWWMNEDEQLGLLPGRANAIWRHPEVAGWKPDYWTQDSLDIGLGHRSAVLVEREDQKKPCVPFTPITICSLRPRKLGAESFWRTIWLS